MPLRAAVLIRAAAGPRIGYGHLVRARSLVRALGGALVTVRAGVDVRAAAHGIGLRLETEQYETLLVQHRPAVVVIDDPSPVHASAALARARGCAVPVLSLHDLGVAPLDSDVAVDGTIAPGAYPAAMGACRGARFAVLDPGIVAARQAAVDRQSRRVLIALGGGPHARIAASVASAILDRVPGVRVRIAAGLVPTSGGGGKRLVTLRALRSLVPELQRCEVAVVAGGVTMYEAAALGTPMVGLAIVPAQRPTIEGFARRGAAIDGGLALGRDWTGRGPAVVAAAVERLLGNPHCRALAAHRASTIVDGLGAFRVADVIRALAAGDAAGRRAG